MKNKFTFSKRTFTLIIASAMFLYSFFIIFEIGSVKAAGTNFIKNPSMEELNPTDVTLPLYWTKDKWGTNTSIFTYPVAGHDGTKAGQVQIISYTGGDAKWAFDSVPVSTGSTYTFKEYYKSNTGTVLMIQYKKTNNTFSYVSLGNIPATTDWTLIQKSFTVPSGIQSVTMYHFLKSIGTLTIDSVSLTLQDDGGIIPPPPISGTGNLISNPSVETASLLDPLLPLDWNTDKWGINTSIFTYPIAGQNGAKGLSVEIKSYTGGDAKWYFKHIPVTPGKSYNFSDFYQSDITSNVTLEYINSSNKFSYVSLGNLPAATNWTQFTKSFTPPVGTVSVSVLHLIKKVGYLKTDNFVLTTTSTGSDVTVPTISIISPVNSSTGSGTIPLIATGSDNVGIVGVQFLLDDIIFGTEITSPPYSYDWDSLKVTNGAHKITAKARDAAGNISTSTPVTINISNTIPDTIAPTIIMNNPLTNSSVSGAVDFSATASDNVGVNKVIFYVDNAAIGDGSIGSGSTSLYSLTFDTTTLKNGIHNVYAEASDAANNSGKTLPVQFTISNPIPDEIVPTVSITSPINGSILSGTSTISISATDNIGIASVHYSVSNGTDVIIGQLTNSPYTIVLSPSALKNGVHKITVYAQDLAGNIGNATPVNFNTFYIAPVPLNPNLILNPSFEIGNGDLPDHWFKGGWGINNVTFNYPVPGIDGVSAAEVKINSITDGDAKWYFEDIPVTPGQTYDFSDQYKSTTYSTVTVRYTFNDGTMSYPDILNNLPPSSTWVKASQSITIPVNVVKLTIFHLINSVGTLDIDDVTLRLSSGAPPVGSNAFPTGFVSLTFDDGWGSHYDNALPLLDAAGIKGSFYIITNEMKNTINENRIGNPALEITQTSNEPSGWKGIQDGDNNAIFTYPTMGVSGSKAVKIDITSYTSGDARWQPDDTTIINGEKYNFTDQYIATVPTTVTVKYVFNDNTFKNVDLGTVPASSKWRLASFTFTPPSNVKTLTIYHKIASIGSLTTDDYHLDLAQGYMNQSQVLELYKNGQEISAHSQTHPFLTTLDLAKATAEISGSRQDLLTAGITPADTFVYPYGDYSSGVVQITKDAGYIGARSADEGYNDKITDKFALKIQQVDSTTTPAQWESWVQTAMASHTWLIMMFHQIDNQNSQYSANPEDFQSFLNYLTDNGIPVKTIKEGIGLMN